MALGYDVLHVLELFNFNICCIRVKFELLNYGWIVGYIHCYEYWFMSPSGRFTHVMIILDRLGEVHTSVVFW